MRILILILHPCPDDEINNIFGIRVNATIDSMFKILLLLISFFAPPEPIGAIPSSRQLAWHDREMYAFIHFGVNTFSNEEWGHGNEDPESFNPSELNTDQWCKVFKDSGLTGVVITAKHHDGFCLWPSTLTDHSVKYSPWKNGNGDILKDLSASCQKYGLHLGVYLSPWDRNNPVYGKGQEYNEYFANQLRDILSNYGPMTEVWFDGACGEGPNGKRQVYDWALFHSVVRELQPNAVIFSDAGPDIRWIGNEKGFAGESNWSTMNRDEFYPGIPEKNTELNEGQEGGTHWLPGEVDVSIRPGWFYHPDQDDKVKSPEKLFQIWLESVGRNANLLLNFPIDRRGLVHETDAANAMAMKQLIDRFTLTDVALTSATTATNTRDGFDSSNVNDDDHSTYWSTEDDVTTGAIQLDFEDLVEITAVDVSEHIQLGQRVQAFTVEVKRNMNWIEVARATTIGNRRILRFEPVICTSIRVNVTKSLGPITLETLKVYETQPNQGRILDEDGGWCWFQDERCIVKDDTLYVGTVSSGYKDNSRKGDINVIKHNLDSGKLTTIEIHDQLELDDHDAPALLSTDDGILAVWSTHGGNWKTHYRKIKLNDSMSKHSTFSPDAQEGYGVTYSNLFKMNVGTIVNFYRGFDWDPNAMVSEDDGKTWTDKGQLLGGPGRPYVRYADDADGNIHFITTEQHPRNFDNSIYHGKLVGTQVQNSLGEVTGELGTSPPTPETLTQVFKGDEHNVSWCNAIEIGDNGHPVIAYSVQKNSAGMKVGSGGEDHRYRYAWFDGETWHDNEVGYAGTRLYAREDDYTGLICIDPENPSTVYFSSNVIPWNGKPLISKMDNKQHYEIWRCDTTKSGDDWRITKVTSNSTTDNIRPMMPENSDVLDSSLDGRRNTPRIKTLTHAFAV